MITEPEAVRKWREADAKDHTDLRDFIASHDDVTGGFIRWRGSLGNEFNLTVKVKIDGYEWTTIGIGWTLEEAYASAFATDSQTDHAIMELIRELDQAPFVERWMGARA